MTDVMENKSFRVPASLWNAALEHAAEQDVSVSDFVRSALTAATGCNTCGGTCEVCGQDSITADDLELDLSEPTPTAAVWGFGAFSKTENPEVQALIDRAKELLAEGAVGVSIATDLDPADLPQNPDDATEEQIMAARQRVRHLAIVDTAAFAHGSIQLGADGNSFSGPIVFEGVPTGDLRSIPFEKLNLDDSPLPIPVIFDLHDGDHTGVTVGFVERMERKADTTPVEAPIAASVAAYPHRLFAEPDAVPITFEDIDGYTRMYGVIASNGCHKASGRCGTYRGADLGYFHSGARVQLDDGSMIRVGRIVSGGVHADAQKLDYQEALARTDDARRIVAMGRAFDTPKGLLFSGVVMPDADLMRLQAASPSIELWPGNRGKLELKTALMVNEPALPFAASVAGDTLTIVEQPEKMPKMGKAYVSVELDIDAVARIERLEKITGELFAAHLAENL